MNKDKLEFFGTYLENSFDSLEYFVESESRINHCYWTPKQERRVRKELEMIKQLDIAKVFHLFCDLIDEVKDEHYFASGPINNSYVAYLLGITNVDADYYELPFERYFCEASKNPPSMRLFVENGSKGKIINRLGVLFGQNKIVRASDGECSFYLSKDNMKEAGVVADTINHSDDKTGYWVEHISSLTCLELERRGCYGIQVEERSDFNDTAKEYFSEEEIYEKTKELFPRIVKLQPFEGIEEVKNILKDTGNVLVYQEQFFQLLKELLYMPGDKAEAYRRDFCLFSRRKNLEGIKIVLYSIYHKAGLELFDYLCHTLLFAITKGYVIGELVAHKHYEEE